jgi:uncharacterized protein (DUF58 family)
MATRLSTWLRKRLRPPRRLSFTREGKWFIGITIGLGIAAINTGNNLLFLLLGMLLSIIVVSGILSEAVLRGLRVRRSLPSRAHAEAPFSVGIVVHNHKRRIPSFSLQIEDRTCDRLLPGKRSYFLKVPAGKTQETTYPMRVERRGRLRWTTIRVSTSFPFGLFRKSLDVDIEDELVVFPAVFELDGRLEPLRRSQGRGGEAKRARQGDFFGLREWRQGDDPRELHWRTTARLGRPMVRELEDDDGRRVVLVVDDGRTRPPPELEHDLSVAASLVTHYLRRGYSVGLELRGGSVPEGSGAHHELRLLRTLALVEPRDESVVLPEGSGPPRRRAQRGSAWLQVRGLGALRRAPGRSRLETEAVTGAARAKTSPLGWPP